MDKSEVWKYLTFILTLLLALSVVSSTLLYMQNGELQRAMLNQTRNTTFEVQIPNVTVVTNNTELELKIEELRKQIEYLQGQLREKRVGKANATIAVLPLVGPIDEYTAMDMVAKIREIERNESIGGVILWVESPGGYVGPVRLIYAELRKLSYKIPIVAYTSSMAGSGGYYVACAADKIVADPLADVGSIGVLYVHYDLEQNYAQNGIKVNVFKTGKYKDMGAEWRDLTDEEKKIITETINTYYNEFLLAVSEGRKLDMNTTKEYATGRSWFARDVEGILVDETGDFEDAVRALEELMNVSSARVIFYDSERVDFGIYQSSSLMLDPRYLDAYLRG